VKAGITLSVILGLLPLPALLINRNAAKTQISSTAALIKFFSQGNT
jgi:hypothetical protein